MLVRFGPVVTALLLASLPAQTQETRLLDYSVAGSFSCKKEPCWERVIVKPAVQKALLELAAGPKGTAELEVLLAGSGIDRQALEKLGLVRREGNRTYLNFTLFTAADLERILPVTEKHARRLADRILAQREEIDAALRSYSVPGVDSGTVAFVVLGCFSLDWDGLEITARKGYRTEAKRHPDGRYVPWATARTASSGARDYSRSSSKWYGGLPMTTFGDVSPRTGFPDFAGRIGQYPRRDILPEALKSGRLDDAWRQLACVMFELREGERTAAQLSQKCGIAQHDAGAWLRLLAELHYVAEADGRSRASIPVLTARDRPMVQRLLSAGRAAITGWLEADFGTLKAELADTAPARSGVPFEEGFTLIYHYVFGRANALLVESGTYADPYAPQGHFKGYSPVVFDPKVLR